MIRSRSVFERIHHDGMVSAIPTRYMEEPTNPQTEFDGRYVRCWELPGYCDECVYSEPECGCRSLTWQDLFS